MTAKKMLIILKLFLTIGLSIAISSRPILSASKHPQNETRQQGKTSTRPVSNLQYWLSHAKPTDTKPATTAPNERSREKSPLQQANNPFARTNRFRRQDALPGVVIFSDGKILPGYIYTTRDKDWIVYVESEKRWRHIPPILVLSISAVVIEEGMEKEWRWKEMGRNEKIFTGRKKPTRRFLWRFHLIDDSYITGAVKGQPLWIEQSGKRLGPFILHERQAGKFGQSLDDLVYVKKIIISRQAMNKAEKLIKTRNNEKSYRPSSLTR